MGHNAIPGSYSGVGKPVRPTNSTDANFPARPPVGIAPEGPGVVGFTTSLIPGTTQEPVPTWIKLTPYGVGAADSTFNILVIGWNQTESGLWYPTPLVQFPVTLSTVAGLAGKVPDETNKFADTLGDPAVPGMGTKGVDCQPTSPANNTIGHYMVDTRGCGRVEFLFAMTGATSGNCLMVKV